jgi:hypothetical protein
MLLSTNALEKAAWILNKTTLNSNTNNNANRQKSNNNSDRRSYSLDIKFNMTKGDCSCSCDKYSTSTPTTSSDSIMDNVDIQKQLYDEEAIIRQKLSIRSYHLPGNNWVQDYAMYIKNNHLVFGLCCRHRLNPVTTKHRLIILLGSLAFGLTVTNAVYLYFLHGDKNYDDTALALSLSLSGDVVDNLNNSTQKNLSLDISNGMAMLWTIGAGAHAMFDLLLWHMIACGYCQSKTRNYGHAGWNMALAVVSIIVAGASFVVLYRAYEDNEADVDAQLLKFVDDGNYTVALGDNEGDSPHRPITIETIKAFRQSNPDFQFLYGYLVELGLSLFVFTPLIQTILFSGVFGCCGTLPLVGGRPRSVKLEQERVKKLARKELPV